MISHVLFDFFGTLVEYSASRSEQGYARSFGRGTLCLRHVLPHFGTAAPPPPVARTERRRAAVCVSPGDGLAVESGLPVVFPFRLAGA